MGVNMRLDFSWGCSFCWDLSNGISGMNWIFRWDFVISSGTFYASANYDYDPDLKMFKKKCNHNSRPWKLSPAWFSRISTAFCSKFSLWDIWQILRWVLVILWELNQSFDVSSIKLFSKIVALETIWVT